MTRTSQTHPLQIAEVTASSGSGRIRITFCPGKKDLQSMSGPWNRDLYTDVNAIRNWGADLVLTLVESHEMQMLQVPDLGAEVTAAGLLWLHLPIVDVSIPGPEFEDQWRVAGPAIIEMLRDSQNIVVHCRGGLGRAGLVAARLLVELGDDPVIAVSKVRVVRSGAIETRQQENYVLRQMWNT